MNVATKEIECYEHIAPNENSARSRSVASFYRQVNAMKSLVCARLATCQNA